MGKFKVIRSQELTAITNENAGYLLAAGHTQLIVIEARSASVISEKKKQV